MNAAVKVVCNSLLIGSLISVATMFHVMAAQAQKATCYEVQDPDGWVNLRSPRTGEVVIRADNGTRFYSSSRRDDGMRDDGMVLINGTGLIVHATRLKRVPSDSSCESHQVVDRDGTANLRQTPNGRVVGTVQSGELVLVVGRSGEWRRVVTDNWKSGFIHSSRLR